MLLLIHVTEGVLEEHRLPADMLPVCIDVLLAANPNPNKEVVWMVAEVTKELLLKAIATQEDANLSGAIHAWCLKLCVCLLENVDKVRPANLYLLRRYMAEHLHPVSDLRSRAGVGFGLHLPTTGTAQHCKRTQRRINQGRADLRVASCGDKKGKRFTQIVQTFIPTSQHFCPCRV